MKRSGAGGGNRTHTLLRAADFESAASTNSATSAQNGTIIQIEGYFVKAQFL